MRLWDWGDVMRASDREASIRECARLFDEGWYLGQLAGEMDANGNPFDHFHRVGWAYNLSPHPLFATDWYLKQNPDVEESGKNPLEHFMRSGWKERRNPHPLFDVDWYLSQWGELTCFESNPILHYIEKGSKEGASPHPLFDHRYYLEQVTAEEIDGFSALEHYIVHGWRLGYRPNVLFRPDYYQMRRGHESTKEPFSEYLSRLDHVDPHPLFSSSWYYNNNPDVVEAGYNALEHYLRSGYLEDRTPHPEFDAPWYRHSYSSKMIEGEEALSHFIRIGAKSECLPSQGFDTDGYKRILGVRSKREVLLHLVGSGFPSLATLPSSSTSTNPKISASLLGIQGNLISFSLRGGTQEAQPILLLDGTPQKLCSVRATALVGGEAGSNGGGSFECVFETASLPHAALAELYIEENGRVRKILSQKMSQSFLNGQNLDAIRRAAAIARKESAVAVVCWDGGHNPIGRAKVLYDVLEGNRPVVLFAYMFREFGGEIWRPISSSNIHYVGIPWGERQTYHRLLRDWGVQFDTLWICKPRLPGLELSKHLSHSRTKLVLDMDDNEAHFSSSIGSLLKPYGRSSIGYGHKKIQEIAAKTVASKSLQDDFGGEIVRHARTLDSNMRRIDPRVSARVVGFLGTVRPHKNVLEAAQMVRDYAKKQDSAIEFHVYGDVSPEKLVSELRASNAKVHGLVPAASVSKVVSQCEVMITGFPSESETDSPITRYQITAKIGDSLACGKPVLVPETESVADLKDVDGIYLFTRENFESQLEKALAHRGKIAFPAQFTFSAAYKAFQDAERVANESARAGIVLGAAEKASPSSSAGSVKTLVLLWKQHDAGIYGRRVDQLARSYKRLYPDRRVIILELVHAGDQKKYKNKDNDWRSDFDIIRDRMNAKIVGGIIDDDGVEYRSISYPLDAELESHFKLFVDRHQLNPSNTVFVVFPIVRPLIHIWNSLRAFPVITDIVDNQFAWMSSRDRPIFYSQYLGLAKSSKHVVFNSTRNMSEMRDIGIIPWDQEVSHIPNWYELPASVKSRPNVGAELVRSGLVYSGNMNDRIHWELLHVLAKSGVEVNLIGGAYRAGEALWKLLEHDNVVYHGPLAEEETISVLSRCKVAVMPHTRDAFSNFMNPLKLHMYAELGLPTVSSKVEGVLESDMIKVAQSDDEFVSLVTQLMDRQEDAYDNAPQYAGAASNARKYAALIERFFATY